jgi:serine/threonine protein kinase
MALLNKVEEQNWLFAATLRMKFLPILHSRQVAHCDLKPEKILVEKVHSRLRFLLTDFGISKILTED